MNTDENEKIKKPSSITIVLAIIGIVYTISPDPIPGPIDDALLDVTLYIIACAVRKGKHAATEASSSAFKNLYAGFSKWLHGKAAEGKMKNSTAEKADAIASSATAKASEATAHLIDVAGDATEQVATAKAMERHAGMRSINSFDDKE